MFLNATGATAKHIPYKGVGPMLTDMIGVQVDFRVTSVPSVQSHLKSGALRAVGAMGATRGRSLPDLPTLKQQGSPSWWSAGGSPPSGPKASL